MVIPFVALLVLASCKQSASDSLTETFAAAESGDFDAFRDGFTRRSGNVLAGMEALAGRGSPSLAFRAFTERPEILGERQIRDLVVVNARLNGQTLPFPMVFERGRWRVDLHGVEQLWYQFGSGPFAPRLFEDPVEGHASPR